MKTTLGVIMLIVSLIMIVLMIVLGIRVHYQYQREVESYWHIAEKASTIEAKSQYIDSFYVALQRADLSGMHDAIIYPTMDNSFDYNFKMLKTLEDRLQEIKGMDVTSFQYQQAISQITAQEQGEASDMIGVFNGTWVLKYHSFLWEWVAALEVIFFVVIMIVSLVIIINEE